MEEGKEKKITKDNELTKESRRLIGQGIMDGLLTFKPGGGLGPLSAYNQGDGGYWQNDGDTHIQGSGDYHQGTA